MKKTINGIYLIQILDELKVLENKISNPPNHFKVYDLEINIHINQQKKIIKNGRSSIRNNSNLINSLLLNGDIVDGNANKNK